MVHAKKGTTFGRENRQQKKGKLLQQAFSLGAGFLTPGSTQEHLGLLSGSGSRLQLSATADPGRQQ